MKKIKKRQNRYFTSIYVWISICFIVLQITFSFTVFFQNKQSISKNIYDINQQMFSQVNYNVNQSDTVIKNVCKSLLMNNQVNKMMNSVMTDDEIYDWIMDFQKLCNPIQMSNPEIHSIYVYNYKMDRYFSSYRYLNFDDAYFNEIFEGNQPPKTLYPISRYIDDPNSANAGKTRVFSYILYETLADSGKPEGAVIVNVKSDMIVDKIKAMNQFNVDEQNQIILFDDNKEPIVESGINKVPSEIEQFLQKTDVNERNWFGMDVITINGEKYVAFTNFISSNNWTVVKLQPYREVYKFIASQRLFMLLITCVFGIFMLFMAYLLSDRIYKPIGNLVKKIKKVIPTSENQPLNDMMMLSNTYDELIATVSEYQKAEPITAKIVNSYYKQNLIIDSNHVEKSTLEALESENEGLIDSHGKYIVCVVSIDNHRQFELNNNRNDRELLKYALQNILSELVSNCFINTLIEMPEDQLVVLIKNQSEKPEETFSTLSKVLQLANQSMVKHFSLSFTVSISPSATGYKEITSLYKLAVTNLADRYISGKASMIFDRSAKDYNQNPLPLENISTGLIEHIKNRKTEDIADDFVLIYELLKQQDCNGLTRFITFFIPQVISTIMQMDKSQTGYSDESHYNLYARFLSMETWNEISTELQKLIYSILDDTKVTAQKDSLLSDTIVHIIQENYADSGLGIQQIADLIKKSPQYIGRVFKEKMNTSITNYINDLRLEKSIGLLCTSKFTISEIVSKIGMESDSQYYRLFKKKYATTPKNYILEHYSEK